MIDLERLDLFLSSDQSPDNCMMLSDLDGFLHGVACCPKNVPFQEWMPQALGGDLENVPPWVINAVTALYTKISDGLVHEPSDVEPIFWRAKEGHVIAMDWCEGFMDAVNLMEVHWRPFLKSKRGAELMAPILAHMIDENGDSLVGLPQEEIDETLDQAAAKIPSVVPLIFKRLSSLSAPPTK